MTTPFAARATEDEARRIASMHDVFRLDWRDPLFAVAGVMESGDAHVFGDVEFRSEPVATAPSITKGNGSLKR